MGFRAALEFLGLADPPNKRMDIARIEHTLPNGQGPHLVEPMLIEGQGHTTVFCNFCRKDRQFVVVGVRPADREITSIPMRVIIGCCPGCGLMTAHVQAMQPTTPWSRS